MNFLKCWLLEFFHIIPLIVSFLFALNSFHQNLILALILMTAGIILGLLITWFSDCQRTEKNYTPLSMLIFFLFYIILAAVFVVYFSGVFSWINWKIDILLGIFTGILLTIARKTITPQLDYNPLIYGFSLCLFFPLIILSLRFSLQSGRPFFMLISGIGTAVFSSLLITFVEYKKLKPVETITMAD